MGSLKNLQSSKAREEWGSETRRGLLSIDNFFQLQVALIW